MGSDLGSILVVDDEPRLVRIVKANLESVGYNVLSTLDGKSAVEMVEINEPDVVILDLGLPGMHGYEVCRRIREFSSVPIIILTARSEEEDKVKGLNLGADDYLTKPFGAEELLARVNALLRRSRMVAGPKAPTRFECGEITIDFLQHKVFVRGQEVSLSPTEYKLLYQLTSNAGRVMLHEELLTKIWGVEYRDEIDYLRVYVRYLRQKIEQDPSKPRYILAKPGVGYIFAQPRESMSCQV